MGGCASGHGSLATGSDPRGQWLPRTHDLARNFGVAETVATETMTAAIVAELC